MAGADEFICYTGEIGTVHGRHSLTLWSPSSGLERVQSIAWVIFLVTTLTEPKLLVSVLYPFTAPEGLTWCPKGIYSPSQSVSSEFTFYISIQPQGMGLKKEAKFGGERYPRSPLQGEGFKMKPFTQCHVVGIMLLASMELVKSAYYTVFNLKPLTLGTEGSPVASRGKFTDSENHLVFNVWPRYLPAGLLPMFVNETCKPTQEG